MSTFSQDIFSSSGRFINDCNTAVVDSLLGLLMSNPDVGLLDFGKVVVRRDYATTDIVKLVSGGASGHEPAHAGFVGNGLLTAAVQGDVFCSPTVTDILRAIKEVSYKLDSGVLVIVQNNTANRLNFGLAVERARSQGIAIKLLVVSEDCSSIDQQQGKRGLTGIVLLNKIAGAMAEYGLPLEDIFSFCQKVHENMLSSLISLRPNSSLTLETCICAKHMGDNEMEIGAGLHGEAGLKRMQKTTVSNTCQVLIEEMLSEDFMLESTTPVVVLINNLGNTLQMEELIFVKEFLNYLQELNVPVARIYHGRYLTALDMRGFSATILKVVDPKILEYLDASCEAPGWGHINSQSIPPGLQERIVSRVKDRKRAMPPGLGLREEEANIVLLAVQFACDSLISCEKQINIIDSERGSGNIGTKMRNGAETILSETKKKTLDFHYPRVFFESLGVIAEKRMGGTLGFLYSILFEAAANSFRRLPEQHDVNANTWCNCLNDAIEVLKSCCKVEFGYGTMYDPLYACYTAIEEALQRGVTGMEAFGLGVSAAEEVAQQTKLPSKRYPDPGAHVVGIWMRAVYEGVKVRCGD